MGVNLKRLLKRIFVWFYTKQRKFVLKVKIWTIQQNSNIEMDNSVRITNSTIFDTRYGGRIKIGRNTEILEDVKLLTYGGIIEIGDNCSINPGTIIYGHGNTKIGNNVLIAGGCMIIPANHKYSSTDSDIIAQELDLEPIIVEDNVWIAHGCSILAGVTIGKGSVVGAGAVVNKNVKENSVVGGVPAKLIKKRK